ncbi:MAG: double-CXXCG motif protein [Acidobacteriota bacterium]|nr:double-CXXCG motif protein [Acidobacteriota bacterium]
MRIFEIKEDQNLKNAGYIDAGHKWGLPGVICPVCKSTWSTVGLEYPTVDLANVADEELYREPRAEPLNVYKKLQQRIQEAFPRLSLLEPGAEFGPLVGKAVGRLDGFVWRAWWTVSLEANAFEKLNNYGLTLPPSIKAELKFKKEVQQVFELELPLLGKLTNGVYDNIQLKHCHACGRDSASKPQEVLIDCSSVPNPVNIFRVSNFRTIILVTERFVEAVTSLNIKGAVFKEVRAI